MKESVGDCHQHYLHDLCDLFPLLLGWVSACRVVCTSMEDKDGVFGSILSDRKRVYTLLDAMGLQLVAKLGSRLVIQVKAN